LGADHVDESSLRGRNLPTTMIEEKETFLRVKRPDHRSAAIVTITPIAPSMVAATLAAVHATSVAHINRRHVRSVEIMFAYYETRAAAIMRCHRRDRSVVVARIGMGLVGAGFVGPHHVDAVRRLGFVDIVAVAGSSDASGQEKARALGARRGYGSYRALIDDPEVQVVHNATPNHLHAEVTLAALAAGKHVVSDKPLARTAAEAKRLVDAARRARGPR
jgi:hypothetical protein